MESNNLLFLTCGPGAFYLFIFLPCLELTRTFSSHHAFQTGSLLLALYFIRTRLRRCHTHSNSMAISLASKEVLYKGLSLSVFPLVSANDACCTHFLTSTPSAPCHSLTPSIFASISNSSSSFSSSSLLSHFTVFVWLLGFVCLLFPDGRRRLHLSGFQVPREIFTALAQALILFPLAGLYDGPFIRSNWKQLSLPVWVRRKQEKADRKFLTFQALSIRTV